MTPTEIQQFNRMRNALLRIARDFQTPQQIRRSAEHDIGLSFDEAIEYAYENIQHTARVAVKGVREKIEAEKATKA